MNKRLVKKMLRKKEQFNGVLYSEGNNGADYLNLESIGEGLIHIDTGHCCVVSINAIVPTEFLTALIANSMMEHNWDINAMLESFGWNGEFTSSLKEKTISKIGR